MSTQQTRSTTAQETAQRLRVSTTALSGVVVFCFVFTSHWSLVTSHFFTSHWSLVTSHSVVEAATGKSETKTLEVGQITQGGGVATSSGRRQSVAIGINFGEHKLTSPKFQTFTGFIATALAGQTTTAKGNLDLAWLSAKTYASGTAIDEGAWQRDADPYFLWQAESPELVEGYSYALDGEPDATMETGSTSWDVAQDPLKQLADGQHTFSVQAVDSAGNSGPPLSRTVWIDTTPPTVGGYTPAAGSLLNTLRPGISVNVSDPHSGVGPAEITLLMNGATSSVTMDETAGVATATGTGLVREGANSIRVEASDRLGNKQAALVWSFTVDTTPPAGTLAINAGAALTTSVYVTLNLTASDAISGVTGMLVSNDALTGYVQESFNPVRELWKINAVTGTQKVYVKFIDTAGNISNPIEASIELHLLAPDTIILSGPAGFTPSTSAQMSFTCPEGGCVFSYAFDHDDWSEWNSETVAKRGGLSYGNHYFRVKAAKESNGQEGIQPEEEEDPTPAERTWIVGVQPPGSVVPYGPPIKLWKID